MDVTGISLKQVAGDAANQAAQDAKLREASQAFEAIFLRHFLGESMEPLLHASPGAKGPGAGFYQYMMTDVIANSLTQQEQFGIASLLQMQLAGAGSTDEAKEQGQDAVNKGNHP